MTAVPPSKPSQHSPSTSRGGSNPTVYESASVKAALIQLRAELVAQADELARGGEPDEAGACVFAAEERADRLAAQFASNDLALAREACAEVASVLWPDAGLPVDH